MKQTIKTIVLILLSTLFLISACVDESPEQSVHYRSGWSMFNTCTNVYKTIISTSRHYHDCVAFQAPKSSPDHCQDYTNVIFSDGTELKIDTEVGEFFEYAVGQTVEVNYCGSQRIYINRAGVALNFDNGNNGYNKALNDRVGNTNDDLDSDGNNMIVIYSNQ